MSSNSVCNHTRDKQIGHPAARSSGFVITRMITDRSPITITYHGWRYCSWARKHDDDDGDGDEDGANANPGLRVNRSINLSAYIMFCLRLLKLKTEG